MVGRTRVPDTIILPYECKNTTENLPEARATKSLAHYSVTVITWDAAIIERFSSFKMHNSVLYTILK